MKYLLVLLFCHFSNFGYSQLKMVKICVGATDTEVMSYLDSLNNLQKSPVNKPFKTTTKDGNLQIAIVFGLDNQYDYTCSTAIFIFERKGGIEFCNTQILMGNPEHGIGNLNFIKDFFRKLPDNKWEYQDQNNENFKILAEYSTAETGASTTYYLSYKDISNVKKN